MEEQLNQPKKKKKLWILILILIIIGIFSLFFLKTSFTISQVVNWTDGDQNYDDLPELPKKDPDRINILLLGARGLEEEGDGKLLSDAMVLASIKKSTGQVALISLPRDLYVKVWCAREDQKINFALAQGGLDCAKKTVSYITDLYVDYAISVNFEALKETIDVLDGVSVYLDKPFEETFQWAKEGNEEDEHWFIKEFDGEERWVFHLPAGKNDLDGEVALYYVRSRYSSDDFDRMRRQQQVILALKQKALSLGVLANPVKIYNLLDILGKNVRTDMRLADIKSLINLISDFDVDNTTIKKKFFDISPEGLLYHAFINDEYVLLPVGDDYGQIQAACKNIFQ
tara:strand:+ start:7568 stop:8593 length:1026 start_codon:yes stop_codon:yes gene_type:complete